MPSLSGDIVAAIVAFAATNVDDFTVLLVFFARTHADSAQKKFGASHVVLGYVLGFTLVCGISLAGLLFSLFIPTAYLSLIAIVPILIGAIGLGLFIRKKCGHRCAAWLGIESAAEAAPAPPSAPYVSPALSEDGDPAVVVVHTGDNALMPGHEAAASAALPSPAPARAPSADADAGVARVDSTALTVAGPGVQRVHSMVADFALERKQTMHSPASSAADDSDSDDDDDDREENCLSRGFQRCCAPVMNRGVLEVIVVTLANGGDTIAVYLPLFAAVSPSRFWIYILVYYACVVVWCLVSWLLLRCRPVARLLSKHGDWVAPLLLMALGAYIVSDFIDDYVGGDGDDDAGMSSSSSSSTGVGMGDMD